MRVYGWAGLVLLAISEFALYRGIEPFHSWFYLFAWWSYILLADNLVLLLRGSSLLTRGQASTARLMTLSVLFWVIFECANFRLNNWAYLRVPEEIWLRWPGYYLAFATVIPGIFITSDLIQVLLYGRSLSSASGNEPLGQPESRRTGAFLSLGAFLCIAPLVWPRYFFPAVWIGPIFLLDPLLERFGIRSLSVSISQGNRVRVWSLLLGGLACGLLWEFWNFWAPSKWVYSIPFFGEWKLFEMPALGFLGFPPFALECWILYHLFESVLARMSDNATRMLWWIGVLSFIFLAFRGIDRFSVLLFERSFS